MMRILFFILLDMILIKLLFLWRQFESVCKVIAMDDIDRRIESILASIEALRESQADTYRLLKETIAEDKLRRAENDKLFKEFKKEIGGIANSNGDFAEEYFENIFCRNKTFAGMQFHEIIRRKRFDDRKRKDEFDLIMINEKNALIIETKYKAKEDDIDAVIEKAESFRYWYPEHKDRNIYLGLASLRFEDNIIGKAQKKGIAIIQQLGDKTVVNDENLKAY